MKRLFLLLLFPLLVLAQSDPLNTVYKPAVNTSGVPANVWATDVMQKILQTNTTAGTTKTVQVYATQGEFADFQVHIVNNTGTAYAGLTFTASAFTCSTGPTCATPFVIPAPSTSANNIVVWREFYQTISTMTTQAGSGAYYQTPGLYPDGLSPNIDPWYHQPTNAFPAPVANNNTQSVWVDVLIPNNAPAGYYSGTITISDSSLGTLATVPIIVAVWQWPASQGGNMPATSSLPSDFGITTQDVYCQTIYNGVGSVCPGGSGARLAQMEAMFLDHRVTVMDTPQQTMTSAPWSNFAAGTPNASFPTILSGAALTVVPTQVPPYTIASWNSLYSSSVPGTWPHVVGATSSNVCNEPHVSDGGAVNCINSSVNYHALTPPFPFEATTVWCDGIAGNDCTSNTSSNGIPMTNAVDIWTVEQANEFRNQSDCNGCGSPFFIDELHFYTAWRATTNPDGITRQLWSYESCSSAGTCNNGVQGHSDFRYPTDNTDAMPAANRAMEWMTFRNTEQGELSFANVCGWPGGNCFSTAGVDPWVSSYTFGNNGSATDANPSTFNCSTSGAVWQNPASSCPYAKKIWVGTPANADLATRLVLPTMRLKLKRDGFQDYEYLKALTASGSAGAATVTTQINSWITNRNQYEFSGTGLMAARTNIGNALHALTFSSSNFPSSGCAIQGSGPNWSCAAGALFSDMNSARAAMADGATLTLQHGAYTLTAPVTFDLNKGITVICETAPNGIGAATGATGCNITSTSTSYAFGIPTWAGNGNYFTKLYRISGLNFVSWPTQIGANNAPNCCSPIAWGAGAGPAPVNEGVFTSLRFDHDTFNSTSTTVNQQAITLTNTGHRSYFYGVLDHDLVLCAISCHFLLGSDAQMDPFTPPNPLGTGNNLFFEDNTTTVTTENNPGEGAFDWDYGLNGIVWRHNTVTDDDVTSHYTMTNYEVYNNLFIKDAGSPNPDGYRAFHSQTNALGEYFNNQFQTSTTPANTVVLSLGTIREGYKVDPRPWPTTLKPTGFVCHPPFCDGNRPPSQTNQGYPYLYQPTRDIATGALNPYYAWNNTANGTFHAASIEDFGFVQVPDYYNNHLQPNRDSYQSVVGAQTSTTSPWNCSTTPGMGWGPLANQPSAASCPVYAGEIGGGYGYAAQTVTGTVGSSASGTASDTVLYQLGASGWKQIYKPYPYPHPLVAGTAQAAFPAFSLAPGAYQGTQSVSLSCSSPSPTIYYTTDGTAPTHISNVFSSALSVATTETINAICVSSGLLDSLTLSGGYFINATAFNAWPTQPGTYPAGTQAIQISNPGQNVQICATDDGSTPTSSGANNGLCGHTHYTNPILIGGINQFVKFACTATCTVAFLTTGINLADSPVTVVHYTLGGSNGLWWEDIGGADATITNFVIGGTAVVNNFGSQPIGVQSGTLPIYVNNIGSISTIAGGLPSTQPTQSTVINSITITGSSAFTRANVTGTGGECGAVPITINAGSYCNLQFVFNPTVAGPATATVAIADNTAGTTHTITLTGTGGASATLTPSPLAFGNQNINTTSAVQFATLTNTSSVTLNINAISVTGNFSNSGTGTCGATLAAGASCTIGLTFSPVATISYSGMLSVTDSAPNSPQTINLTGQGTQATIAWTSSQTGTTYNYGSIVIGVATQSAQQTLTNTGTGPLTVALTITGTNAAQFNTPAPTSNCPGSLPAGQSCQVVVTFNPNSAANFTAFLTETDALASNSPQNLTLNGTGVTIGPIVAPSPTMIISQNRSPKNETDSAFGSNVAYLRRRGFGANPPGGSFLGGVSHYRGDGLQRVQDFRRLSRIPVIVGIHETQ